MIIESSRSYGRGLLRAVGKYANLHGGWNFYRQAPFYADRQNSRREWFKNIKADGIIAHTSDSDVIEQILDSDIPAVVNGITETVEGVTNIRADSEAITKMAVDHFKSMGFERMGFCGFEDMFWAKERSEYFKKFTSEMGAETCIYQRPLSKVKYSWNQEQNLMIEWLLKLPKPIAIMACNDDFAQHVIEACKIAEIKIPEEVALLGVDNDDLICDLSMPPLSSISLNIQRAGYLAAQCLSSLMSYGESSIQEIPVHPVEVVQRQSTSILAIDDPYIARAIDFINKNIKNNIQVTDVVEQVPLTRRSLELRFKKVLSRTVYQQIKQTRIELISKLLINTNLTISEISYELGCVDIDNISRFFKKEKSLTPRQFRKKFGKK